MRPRSPTGVTVLNNHWRFAVVGDVRLREERTAVRVDPRGHQRHREVEHAAQQVLALVLAGDRVQVDDAVEKHPYSSTIAAQRRNTPR